MLNLPLRSLLVIILIRGRFCFDCVSPVKSCPCSEKEWEKRSSTYNCTDRHYICMLTFNNSLAETCIHDYAIIPAARGCPAIISCFDGVPTLAIEKDFIACPTERAGCPPADHSGYSLTKLYQFPECIGRNASFLCSTYGDTIIEEGQSGSLKVVLGVVIPICVFVFGAIFCYLRRRYQTKKWEAKRKVRLRADYTHVPISEHYENANTPISDAEDLDCIPAPTDPSDVANYGKRLLLSSGDDYGDIGKCRDWLTRAKEKFPGEINSVINYMDTLSGSTPLSEAIHSGKKDVVALLLMEGADFEILNEMNENPVQQAFFHTGPFGIPLDQQSRRIVNFLEKLLATSDHLHITEAKINRFKDVVEKVIQEYKDVPQEIIDMGREALRKYRQNIKHGSLPSYYIRCMLVGHYGVGKTTLVRGLLNKDQSNIQSTDGIDVYREMCYIKDGNWEIKDNTFHTEDILGLKNVIQVDFWDFAGQAVYYSTHPTYFSDRCLYLLVINVALSTTDEVDDMDMDPSRASRRNVMDFLTYWIGTILHYSGHTKEGYPKIIVIGTHRDEVEDETHLETLEGEIKHTFKEYIATGQLICNIDYFVNAKFMPTGQKNRIRSLIEKHGETYPGFGYKIPKSWIDIQRKLRCDYKDENVNIMPTDDLITICETLGTQMRDKDLSLFLEFYTSLGQMLYFKESGLNNYVILEPMWLVNAMKCLITKEERLKQVHELGKITKEEILKCFKTEDPQYIENQEHIMKVLDKLDLVCNPKTYDEAGSRLLPNFYYIPSIFKESGIEVPDPKWVKNEQIAYSFENQILPPAVYHRLVCSFISAWKVHEQHLYCDAVQLQIQNDILVRFRRQQHQFFLTVYFIHKRRIEDIIDVTKMIHSYILQACDRIIKSYTRSNKAIWPIIRYNGGVPLQFISSDDYEGSLFPSTKSKRTKHLVLSDEECKMPLSDLHLVKICSYLTMKEQEDVLRNLPRGETEHEEFYILGNRCLLSLNEWRTSLINDGKEVIAGMLKGIIVEKVLKKALTHMLPEVSSLPDELKFRKVTDEFLDTVAYRMGTKYFVVAVSLGLEIDEVIVIVSNNPKNTLKINQEILQTWSKKEGENGRKATYGTLASAFKDANCRIDDFPGMLKYRRKDT